MNSPLPHSPQDPLAHLQDIHLPAAIGLWPPAWGWWLLLLIVIATITSSIYFLRRHKIRNAYRALALTELATIKQHYDAIMDAGVDAGNDANKNSEYLQAVSILLRRTAISGFGSQFNVNVKGEDWLLWLDAQSKKTTRNFSEGVGRTLLTGPYQKAPVVDRNRLHNIVELWIRQHRNQWQKKSHTQIISKNTSAHTYADKKEIDNKEIDKPEANQHV